ncbi:dephospho-CoA kinase/protein folding accessory domain-containing protein [Peptococcaceae bacterium CEB3]|nr:dephospho-CoA kinase/protein folding accessory domain-containing protein [Peptococcaceae bacterium CEB3]
MRIVCVVDYDPRWPGMFEAEASLIREVFGEELLALHHIGSTSVPGLRAKPIIDMMPVVRDIEAVDRFNDKMVELGYEPMGEFGISRRRYFRKGGDARTHHVHIFQEGSEDIKRHLAFRDFLRSHEDAAREYGTLKTLLAERFPEDIESYMDGKDSFIKDLEAKALAFYRNL